MLEGHGLTYVYESGIRRTVKTEAVSEASVSVDRGQSAAIVGESGSGKTTLLKMLTLQLKPKSGEVFFDGKRADGRNRKETQEILRRIQLVPQNPYDAVDPRWTVARSVAEPLHLQHSHSPGDINRTVDSLFDEVGLSPELKTRFPYELSGGELQRAVIARALSLEPEVLVCDEATSMLDVSVQAYIMSILKNVQKKRGVALLFVTHDLGLAGAAADMIYVMHRGRIVESGTDVLAHPNGQYAKELVGAMQFYR